MLVIIALVFAAIVALSVLSLAAHLLFSPFLLLVAVAVLVWLAFRPRRSRR
jgi:threonine/homoserine/homoserine lactone efflux protein